MKLTAVLLALCVPLVAQAEDWRLPVFTRPYGVNPVIRPHRDTLFACPMRGRPIRWQALHTFNPAAVVRDGRVWLLYRAEDDTGSGIGGHTSRLGLAVSRDGLTFVPGPLPVFYPDRDAQAANEWDGGCEDPRLVEDEDGRYVITYTQWNRRVPRMAIASSRDLVHWTKHGTAFAEPRYRDVAHKSGAILTHLDGGRLKAARLQGKYWMYWGEGGIRLATSPDLVHWTPVEDAAHRAVVLLPPRPGHFDSDLAEAGPPPILTPRGIVVLYNGKNAARGGEPSLSPGAYASGQALFDAADPARLLVRDDAPCFRPELPFERTGQYPAGTTFAEGLVHFGGHWLLYYGCADSFVAVAQGDANDTTTLVHGQPAWTLANDTVSLAATRLGGHTAPVTFFPNDAHPIAPYYISPWQGEHRDLSAVPVLVPLRGDFFCIPFGGNGTPFRGERHPPHGETAGSAWSLAGRAREGRVSRLQLALDTTVRPGHITRTLALVDGQPAVYDETVVRGFAGPTSYAHHAILALPKEPGALALTCRPFASGMVAPYVFSDPAKGERQSLPPGARFTDLARIPTPHGPADRSALPAQRGYADLLETSASSAPGPDWIAAVNRTDGWLWFALKDPAVLPSRVYWIEDHGRDAAPWAGRNACVGLEDACAFFDRGVAESAAPNALTRLGVPTARTLTGAPFAVRTIQGAVRVPPAFGRVTTASFTDDAVTFTGAAGQRVTVPVRTRFVFDGKL